MKETLWPLIGPLIGGGRYISLEDHSSDLAEALDQTSGIDGIQLLPGGGSLAIATRVQFGPQSWDSFTVRFSRTSGAETELAKRLRELERPELLAPYWTIQAYCTSEGEPLSIGAIRTADLYPYIRAELASALQYRHHVIRVRENGDDGNCFLALDWAQLASEGHKERFRNLKLSPIIWRA